MIFEEMAEYLRGRYRYGLLQLYGQGVENLPLPQQSILLDQLREALAVMPLEWVKQLHLQSGLVVELPAWRI